MGSKEKITLILIFNYGKKRKSKIMVCWFQNKVDSLAKNLSNYENCVVEKKWKESLKMVYSLTHGNGDGVTLKKQIVKRKLLEKKLEENTEKMKRIKKK